LFTINDKNLNKRKNLLTKYLIFVALINNKNCVIIKLKIVHKHCNYYQELNDFYKLKLIILVNKRLLNIYFSNIFSNESVSFKISKWVL
jgi:hypothetical protein